MIKANELRIGNYILINGSIVRIGYGVIQDVYQKNKGIRNQYLNTLTHEPIPLTPEILEKAGFKFYEKSEMYEKDDFMDLHILYDNAGYCIKDYELNIWSPNILYLHQLQNLYFALTGEELEINL
jgi:hypothetical protein